MFNLEKLLPFIFASTLFLSATLVFSVQPMLGKMMLPHVGGAPSGWAVTMFFFQTCLLFGYGLAYIFSKLPPFLNALSILFVFLPAALFLPIAYKSGVADSISPWAVFLQLTASTAVPFLALSTLSPGLQRLFSFSNHRTASDPYYLYAASNAGSFVGLLAYPIILEPLIGLQAQSQAWMMAFGLLFFCVMICAVSIFIKNRDLISLKLKSEQTAKDKDGDDTITWTRRFKWLALAAIPSSLMIGTTTEITTDIASAPMIWVLPLSIYLLTTIVAFAKRHIINTNTLSTMHFFGIIVITCLIIFENYDRINADHIFYVAFAYIAIFTIIASLLHSLLANDRPSAKRLTEFYLIISLGGAIGGSFNAFIAPNIFNDVYEFQFIAILSLLLSPAFGNKIPPTLNKLIWGVFAALIIVLTILSFKQGTLFMGMLIVVLFMASIHPKVLFGCALAIMIFLTTPLNGKNLIHIDRNFFGVVKVYETIMSKNSKEKILAFLHGTTLHGFQAVDEEHAHKPYSYYGVNGPIGDVFDSFDPKEIVVLGLGVGQISCHNKAGREFTYYEIDPHVVDVALKDFTILKTCGYKDIIVGDARLEIAKDPNTYDTIVVDTFSSDSVPVHLVTKEAIDLYASKLKENGIILINISNRHLDLSQPIASIAKALGYNYRSKYYTPSETDLYNTPSEWVVLTKNAGLVKQLDDKKWHEIKSDQPPWTDDYSNVISTLKIFDKNRQKNKYKTKKDSE